MAKCRIMYDYQIFFLQEYGGVSRYHVELVKALKKIGHENAAIKIRVNKNEYLQKEFGIKKTNRKRSIHGLINKADITRNKLYCSFSSFFHDIVHITWIDPYINVRAKEKLVVTIHDMIHEIFWSQLPSMQEEIEGKKRAIYDSKAIIAISENTKKDILRFYPDIPESKITVVYHGANRLPPPQKPNLSIEEGTKYLLYVGRRSEYKGFMFMAEALKEFLCSRKDIILIVVGSGPFTEKERDTLQKLGIIDSIMQADVSDSELAYLYRNAICFLYPSVYEGFGFPILEAFDCNCPVICTNASSLPEVGGDAAVYFKPNDADGLLKCVEKIMSDAEFRESCIQKGIKQAEKFTWERCANETYAVYYKVWTDHKIGKI